MSTTTPVEVAQCDRAPLEHDWSDPNVGHLIGLLLREGFHSNVWFKDQLVKAAYLIADARHRHAAIAEMKARVFELEARLAAVRSVIEGGYPDQPTGVRDQCPHGRFSWEDCIVCYDDALLAALKGSPDGQG